MAGPLERTQLLPDLPPDRNPFVGRQREMRDLTDRLSEAPLVTIAGPGGAGKTRLAVHLARRLGGEGAFSDGIAFVELASLTDPRAVPTTIAQMFNVPELSGRPAGDVLVRLLRDKSLLLVLDNCEHVIDASAELVSALLRGCPRLRVLTTTREPLHIDGEVVYRIPPLHVPGDDRVESLANSEAAQLFVLRARAGNAAFALGSANAAAVGDICRRLDGLPLAIELAAARVSTFAPADIAGRLDSTLRLAQDGPRDAPERQRTLRATIDWSYALLEPGERELFQRLSVFAGGFTVDAALAIAADGCDALDVLPGLVSRSMVQMDPQPDGGVRYRILEPLRQFAHDQLAHSGNLARTRELHATHILNLAESPSADADLLGMFERWQHLNSDADNIRVAFEWAFESTNARLAVRLGAGLWMWWSRPDRATQGKTCLQRIRALPLAAQQPRYSRVVVGHAYLALLQGEMLEAVDMADEAWRLAERTHDAALAAVALSISGTAHAYRGNVEMAELLLRRSTDYARLANLRWIEMLNNGSMGALALSRGDLATAERDIYESVRVAEEGPSLWCRATAYNVLGDLMRARGEAGQAGRAYEDALALYASLDPHGKYVPHGLLHNIGHVALARGEGQRAATLFVESADIYRAVGSDRRGLSECIIGLACTAVYAHEHELAARLFGSAEAELDRLGTLLSPGNRTEYERGLAALGAAMGPEALAQARDQGRRQSLEDALDQGRTVLLLSKQAAVVAPRLPVAFLTTRELEVARLLAQGLSNRQIAAELVITEKTAKNHVQHVLEKLAVRSRAEVAARADDLGLRMAT